MYRAMGVMVEGGLLPSYNERVVYIYIERTFLDKKLSPSCGQGPRRITRAIFITPPLSPNPLGMEAGGQTRPRRLLRPKDISLTHERVNVLAVGPLFGRKG